MDTRSQAAANAPMSRIENDIEALKGMKHRVEVLTDRIIKNARALGYYDTPKDIAGASTPTAVTTTLADALRQLEYAIDTASGSLNVFD